MYVRTFETHFIRSTQKSRCKNKQKKLNSDLVGLSSVKVEQATLQTARGTLITS